MLVLVRLKSRLSVHAPPVPVVHVSSRPVGPKRPLTTAPATRPWSRSCTRTVTRARQVVDETANELESRSPAWRVGGGGGEGGGGGGGGGEPAGPVERSMSNDPPSPSFGDPRYA